MFNASSSRGCQSNGLQDGRGACLTCAVTNKQLYRGWCAIPRSPEHVFERLYQGMTGTGAEWMSKLSTDEEDIAEYTIVDYQVP